MAEYRAISCPQCNNNEGNFDPKTRQYACPYCHRTFTLERKEIVNDEKVMGNCKNAVRMFEENNIELAFKTACDILEVSYDSAPANYIVAYYREVVQHEKSQLESFFKQKIAPFIDNSSNLEENEVYELEKLFTLTAKKISDYEMEILKLIDMNSQGPEMIMKELEFVEKLCPYWIANRQTSGYLTSELARMYMQLASVATIPKTCYALYNSIVTISDSPVVTNSFFLKTKCENFLNEYILPIGQIISFMRDPATKEKYCGAFEKRKNAFVEKMKQ